MKRAFIKKIILLLICLLPVTMIAQEKKPENKGAISSHAQRRAARQKWKDQRRQERAEKKAISDHAKRLQSKQTLKRMKQEKKKSDRLRNNKKESFFVRLFKYKH